VTDFVEMFRHWNAGRSQVQIYKALKSTGKRSASIWPRHWPRVWHGAQTNRSTRRCSAAAWNQMTVMTV
jgi:hypothetical protein